MLRLYSSARGSLGADANGLIPGNRAGKKNLLDRLDYTTIVRMEITRECQSIELGCFPVNLILGIFPFKPKCCLLACINNTIEHRL